jgi:sugar lactone lactonase YvrE
MKSGRFVLCFAAILFAIAITSESIAAQTAHFSGVVSSLVTGYSPSGVAVDLFGNVYIADSSAGAVHEFVAVNGQVSANSTVITVSGFNKPSGIAVDAKGNVFVGDTGNNAVKEIVATSGAISSSSSVVTVGSGFSAPSGVAVDALGDVFVADTGHNAVKEIVAVSGAVSSGSTVNVVGSGFSAPAGVAVDGSGNVFVADTGNNGVKEIVAVSGAVSSTSTVNIVGSGFSAPTGVTLDGGGDLFVIDKNGIEEVLSSGGSVSATSLVVIVGSEVGAPAGIAVDGKGNLFVGDTSDQAVDEIHLGLVDFGSVKVGSTGGTVLLPFIFDSAGKLGGWTVLTQGAANLEFNQAASGTTCSKTTEYSAGDTCSIAVSYSPQRPGWRPGAVQLLDSSGNVLATGNLKGTGVGPEITFANSTSGVYLPSKQTSLGGFYWPIGLTVDASGNVFVADTHNFAVKEIVAVNGSIPASPTIKTLGGSFSSPWRGYPWSVVVDGAGNIFVGCDRSGSSAVYEIVAAGGYTLVKILHTFAESPHVAVDGSGNVFVATERGGGLYEIVAAGGYTTVNTLGSGFSSLEGVAVDGSGNVFVSDAGNNTVKEILAVNGSIPPSPTIRTLASGFSGPGGMTVDGSGNVFIAGNGLVREIVAAGGYSTIRTLGSGFNTPSQAAVDGTGNVFVSDYDGNSMVELDYADPPSLTFPATDIGSQSQQQVTVSNVGNADLTFPIPSAGDNPSLTGPFALDAATTCPQVSATSSTDGKLAKGQSCVYAVDFLPTATSTNSGSLAVADNNLNASPATTQTISMTGTVDVPPTKVAFTVPPQSTLEAGGTPAPVKVSLEDAAGNVTEHNSTVTLTVTGPNSYSQVYTAAAASGVATFNSLAALSAAGTYTYTAADTTDSGVTPAVATEQVVPPTKLVFTTPPQGTLAASLPPGSVKVSLEFAGGDVAVTYSSTVTLTVTGPNSYSQVYTAAAASGVATFNSLAALNTTGAYTYTATDTPDGLTQAVATQQVLPSQASYTAPSTNVGSSSATQTATLLFVAPGTLNGIDALTQGAANLDFQLASGGTCSTGTAYTAGQTCTVNYVFSPLRPGLRMGAIQLTDSSSNVLATAYISGTGVGPLVTFANATSGNYVASVQSTLGSGFADPVGVAVDASGNVFVADRGNNAVKKILAAGGYITVNTLGSGFNTPNGVAVDGAGNVFVGDSGNHAVKEIVAAGGYTTVKTLGSGFNHPTGMSVDGSGNVFVADWLDNAVYLIEAAGGYTAVKTLGSGFQNPDDTAVDGSGNVFVSDFGHNAVKEILAVGGYTTVNTLGSGFNGPGAVAVDASGNVYVGDERNGAVKEIVAAGGYTAVNTLGQGFNVPAGIAVDGSGNFVVVENGSSTVAKLDYADPPSLTFPATDIGSQSQQLVTASNVGNADLTFPIPSAGDNPSLSGAGFTLDGASTCPQVSATTSTAGKLATGSSCDYVLDFKPTTEGAYSGSLTLTDNNLNASPAITQTISMTGTANVVPPFGKIEWALDLRTGSTTVAQSDSLRVSGWAMDAQDGAPLSKVQILIDGNVAGNATLGIARPVIAALYPKIANNLDSGWTFTMPASGLSRGTHTIAAVANNSLNLSTTLRSVNITVDATSTGPPIGLIEGAYDLRTGSTTVASSDSLRVSGWAMDPQDGAPLSKVQILIDGKAAGNATLGIARPAIAALYPQIPNNLDSGWTFTMPVSGLFPATITSGTHTVAAVAYDSLNLSTTLGSVNIKLGTSTGPPIGLIERAYDLRTGLTTVAQSDSLWMSGWAMDPQDGAPVKKVQILIDGNVAGNASLDIARPAIAALYPYIPNNLHSGWTFTMPASGLTPGKHTITAVAYDSLNLSGTLSLYGTWTINVSP